MYDGIKPDHIKINDKKGFNYIKEAAEKG